MNRAETWLPVPDWPRYEISDQGRVRRSDTGLIVNGTVSGDGYRMFFPARAKATRIHRMVLRAFVGEPPAGHECRHLDGDRQNNALDNLAWGTRAENVADTIRHGRHSNRADRMLEVLRDGRTYSRAEIVDRAGWLMTNNAAAELRARGYDIRHSKKQNLDTYRLVSLDGATSEPFTPIPSSLGETATLVASSSETVEVHPMQPALFEAA